MGKIGLIFPCLGYILAANMNHDRNPDKKKKASTAYKPPGTIPNSLSLVIFPKVVILAIGAN